MELDYLLIIISLLLTVGAQILVSVRYSKYKSIKNSKGVSGSEVAIDMLKEHGLDDIYVVECRGNLTDHYDPSGKVIRLSSDIFHGESIASLAVAAHEVGHAIQYKEGNVLIKIRSFIYPLVSLASNFSYIAILLGLILGILELFYVGVALFAIILLFQLLTLPVEIDASKKAMKNLKVKYLSDRELDGAHSMLVAAAMTYVASLATTVIQLIRLILMGSRRD